MPKLFVFNPGHEEALLHKDKASYTPNRLVRQMMSELPHLMLLFAEEGDFVYCPANGLSEPYLINHKAQRVEDYRQLPRLQLELWGWEPHICRQLYRWAQSLGLELTMPAISEGYYQMAHRRSAGEFLRHLYRDKPHLLESADLIPEWFPHQALSPEGYGSVLLGLGYREAMMKRPFSSSGRGVEGLDLPLSSAQSAHLAKSLRASSAFSLEPRLQRVQDYSCLFCVGEDRLDFIGLSKFATNPNQRYAYAYSHLTPSEEIAEELIQALDGLPERWEELLAYLERYLWQRLEGIYTGYLGIDMMTYLDSSGRPRLHPCIEINLRCTMGVVALQAAKRYNAWGRRYHLSYLPEGLAELERTTLPNYLLLSEPIAESKFFAYID